MPHVQANSVPYSSDFKQNLVDARAQTTTAYPELVKPLQERVGCLMYAATCTRPDIAFFVHQVCQALQKPTPELLQECDHCLSYLARLSSSHSGRVYRWQCGNDPDEIADGPVGGASFSKNLPQLWYKPAALAGLSSRQFQNRLSLPRAHTRRRPASEGRRRCASKVSVQLQRWRSRLRPVRVSTCMVA